MFNGLVKAFSDRAAARVVAAAFSLSAALPLAAAEATTMSSHASLAPLERVAKVPTARWSASSATVGEPLKVTVAENSVGYGDELTLMRRFPDRWRVAARDPLLSAKGWRFVVPTDQYGAADYRVQASGANGVVEKSDVRTITVVPAYDPAGSANDFAFLTNPRWRWDSCAPIDWKFNPKGSLSGGLRMLKSTARRLEAATGHNVRYRGRTSINATPDGNAKKPGTVIIGWRSPASYKPFQRNPTAVGVGGATFSSGYLEADRTRVSRAQRGGVVLNSAFRGKLDKGFGAGVTWGDVMLHEWAHVLGLGHVAARAQLMYPSLTAGPARFEAGDLRGLEKVGSSRGCLSRNARESHRNLTSTWAY